MERVEIRVAPDLEMLVQAAREANVRIQEVNFVRNGSEEGLESLRVKIAGKKHALGYFSYLLEEKKLLTLV